ncbi:protein suppressor of white apricot isoform X2 [Drosophila willistoni]|uniref:protein suppressor of white apricot isoform X2 n=1 Tax=Drosophila willistoni TaxID=7260 RepID=UPI000C26CEE9|nr:protein suppressor of white apricot isoform X2 [Drosophila willistoni]
MMPLSYNNNSDSSGTSSGVNGILRKTGGGAASSVGVGGLTANGNSVTNSLESRQPPLELLVFGYACKIFRDDDKARELDHGKQLIPWMGDINLKIDRYDVRGALCDLSTYEAPPGGYGNRLEYLSAEEQRAEQLCEEERYLFLYNNEEELRLQQEEDLKRLQQETSGGSYSNVGFQYDGGGAQGTTGVSSATTTPQLSPGSGAANEESELPFVLPRNLMVAPAPGIQLPESMKQHAIIEKTARFIATQGIQMEILIKAKQSNNSQFDFLCQGGQLQPYYRHLLEAIKQGKFIEAITATDAPDQQENMETDSSSGIHSSLMPDSPKRSAQVVITVPTIKYKPSANCAYTQLISKIKGVPLQAVIDDELMNNGSQHSGGTASPASSCQSDGKCGDHSQNEFTPVLIQYNGSTFAHEKETVDEEKKSADQDSSNGGSKVELLKNTSALALAQGYSSESDEEDNNDDDETATKEKPPEPILNFPLPEENLKHIIDKTAIYVIKNGRQFEETLRSKSVERFSFLLPESQFYPYYMYKITGDVDAASKEEKTRKAAAVAAALMSKKGLTFGKAAEKAPVSFSIRARDDQTPLPSSLNQHEASDEDNEDAKIKVKAENNRSGMPDSVQRAIKQVETQLLARSAGGNGGKVTSTVLASDSPQKDQRQAEERVKDKLAQKARDKLNGMISKEKQLQQERKRKAMAFLNQIKGEKVVPAAAESSTVGGNPDDALSEAAKGGDSDAESTESVRSIPITYFGPDDDEEPNAKPGEAILTTVAAAAAAPDEEDDDEEGGDGDLEKYNLLNDDSTNTFTSKHAPPRSEVSSSSSVPQPPSKASATAPQIPVLLSDDDDDDDVQVVNATSGTPRRKSKRKSRSRDIVSSSSSSGNRSSRSRCSSAYTQRRAKRKTPLVDVMSTSSSSRRKPKRHRSRSRSRSRTPHNSPSHNRPRSYQKHRSRSRSRSKRRGSHSRSRSRRSSTSRDERHHRRRRQRSTSMRRHLSTPQKKSHKRHKRRRRSSS